MNGLVRSRLNWLTKDLLVDGDVLPVPVRRLRCFNQTIMLDQAQ